MTAADDPRVGDLLGRAVAAGAPPRAAIVGFPCDEGVRRNGGRPGAAAAPAEVRRWLARLTPDARAPERFTALVEHTRDMGDVPVTGDLEADQQRLAEAVTPLLARGVFVVVLGGGHETAYGHFLGYAGAALPVTIVNWDAHPDVRPLRDGRGHSGSPFRQAREHASGLCRAYHVAGLLPQSTAAAHAAWVRAQGGTVVWRDEVTVARVRRLYAALPGPTMATFDIDAVDQSQAPGVSAPATGGLPASLWLEAAYRAGRSPHVRSCDVVEVNPAHDRDGQTARLAAMTVWQVLRGVAAR